MDQLTGIRLARHNRRRPVLPRLRCRLVLIEPQVRTAFLIIAAVAGETTLRQDRPYVPVEIYRTVRRDSRDWLTSLPADGHSYDATRQDQSRHRHHQPRRD